MNTTTKATLIGATAIVMWGTLALLTQLTEGRVPPFQLMAITFSIAFLLMLGRWRIQGHWGTRYFKQPASAWAISLLGIFGNHFCYFMAMTMAPAVEVSLIAYLWPLAMVLLSALLPDQHLKAPQLAGALLAVFGCWLLVGKGSNGFNSEYLSGYLFAFGCVILWSSYSVANRLVAAVPTDAVGWFCAVTAVLSLFCHWLWEDTQWPATTWQWIGVVALGLGPLGVAFFTWDYGVKFGHLATLGILSYAAPLISVTLLVLANKAEASWSLLWACIAIVGGSALAGLSMRRQAKRAQAQTA